MSIFPERTMWRFGSSYVVFASLSFLFRSGRHVLHIDNLCHIIGWDERFVSVPKIVQIHCCHSVLWVYLYPSSRQNDPFALKQRDLKIMSVVKFPYVHYVTIIRVLSPLGCCIKADTAVLVGALLILGDCVKCIPIYLLSFVSQYSQRWSPGQQV